ncbi:hypothetical protein HDU98_009368 [Podochytrium sp. JEL0797]|nr:hypothetical protein HDU98_009368 [Podochytrium sp. JEL0797]
MFVSTLLALASAASVMAASGEITFYDTTWNTIATACGKSHPPASNTLFAAVSFKSLSDQSSIVASGICGRCIRLQNVANGGSTLVTVVDVMMRADAQPDDLDLSNQAFIDVVGSLGPGVQHGVQWEWADCSGEQEAAPAPVIPKPAPVVQKPTQVVQKPTPVAVEQAPQTHQAPEFPVVVPKTTTKVIIQTTQAVTAPHVASAAFQGWTSAACFKDAQAPFGSRLLPNKLGDAQDMTLQKCGQLATDSGYPFFGVEHGSECWAAFEYSHNPVFSAECRVVCTGDATEICGGSLAINVYSAQNYLLAGCYEDAKSSTGARLMKNLIATDDAMTVGKCADMAKAAGYGLFGLEWGVECWGDNEFEHFPAASNGCDVACPGNRKEKCGGSLAVSAYITQWW